MSNRVAKGSLRGLSFGTGWKHWFPYAVIFAILLLAPAVANAQTDTLVVRWTAPGDDGSGGGPAAGYDLRVSDAPIDESNFTSATQVAGLPAPASPGTRQKVVVRGLTAGNTYYFAIKTRDNRDNWSPISNLVRFDWILDTAPPSAPAVTAANSDSGDVHIAWSPNPEPDLAGYRVYRATQVTGPYTLLTGTLVTGVEFTDTHVPAGQAQLWYRVTAVDTHDNESARSAVIPVAVSATETAELHVVDVYPNPSRLSAAVWLRMSAPAAGASGAVLEVYDSGEHRVRHLDLGPLPPGLQDKLAWDGRNDAGVLCAPGVYRAWLVSSGHRETLRIVRVP